MSFSSSAAAPALPWDAEKRSCAIFMYSSGKLTSTGGAAECGIWARGCLVVSILYRFNTGAIKIKINGGNFGNNSGGTVDGLSSKLSIVSVD